MKVEFRWDELSHFLSRPLFSLSKGRLSKPVNYASRYYSWKVARYVTRCLLEKDCLLEARLDGCFICAVTDDMSPKLLNLRLSHFFISIIRQKVIFVGDDCWSWCHLLCVRLPSRVNSISVRQSGTTRYRLANVNRLLSSLIITSFRYWGCSLMSSLVNETHFIIANAICCARSMALGVLWNRISDWFQRCTHQWTRLSEMWWM